MMLLRKRSGFRAGKVGALRAMITIICSDHFLEFVYDKKWIPKSTEPLSALNFMRAQGAVVLPSSHS